ncbi:Protein CBR-NLP-35 [Caenorhabditis briggsae]|uniref:Uncharacterized protein n=2 Tax=Caenorhabditis briggsae TaxID=6238 RepID=A0AAE9D3X0_CAEBR|nr:Protein CBR-NLP-35 [Caenorhabditis briggsae]ULT94219.1 hypothetical protein L3Y34_003592 [Caenorhabditis briggsae]UMM27457.1 hypothetical protein L5515_010740 [Caenorhabditis briggsae]CAP37151.1 Protein CBR-NLP-35 [Caenorhabditis briggsae]
MPRVSSLIVFFTFMVTLFAVSHAAGVSGYDNIYQVLAPRFRRARLMSFDGEAPQYLQHLLQNLKPRFRRSV